MRRYRIGPFEVHGARLLLAHGENQVSVGRKVVDALAALIESPEVATKDALLRRIWPDARGGEANLVQSVHVLRRLFREHGVDDAIETIPGVGYRLKLPARSLGAPQSRNVRAPGRLRFWVSAVTATVAVLCIYPIAATLRSRSVQAPANAPWTERLYAIGRYYWNLRTASGVHTSVKYFTEVIERDPESPLGYAGMADAYATIGDYCYGTHRPKIYFARAAAYARQSMLRDPAFAPAHATLGFLLLHEKRPDEAIAELRRALTLDARYAPAHEWYGIALALKGRRSAARAELTLATQLAPLSVAPAAWLGALADRDGRFADARIYARDVRELAGSFGWGRRSRDHPTWAAVEATAAAAIAP